MKDRIFISIPKFFFWTPVYHAGYLSYPIRRISTITFGELFLSASNSIIIVILLKALHLNLYIRSLILDWSFREHLQVSRALPVTVIFIYRIINSSGIFFRLDTLQVNQLAG